MMYVKEVSALLGIDDDTAREVVDNMAFFTDIRFSSCTTREFNKAARETYSEIKRVTK